MTTPSAVIRQSRSASMPLRLVAVDGTKSVRGGTTHPRPPPPHRHWTGSTYGTATLLRFDPETLDRRFQYEIGRRPGFLDEVLSRNGVPATGSPWWIDSLDLGNGESYDIAFLADYPGVWMDHYHNVPAPGRDSRCARTRTAGAATTITPLLTHEAL
jgi:hypothetical protein